METPYTPAVPLFLALREACLMIEEEGLPARIARHQKMSGAVQAAAKAWGLSPLPEDRQTAQLLIDGHRS